MLSTVVFYRFVVPKWRKFWTARSDLNSSLFAVLSGVRVVKAFAQERREGGRFQKVSGTFFRAGTNVGYARSGDPESSPGRRLYKARRHRLCANTRRPMTRGESRAETAW